MASFNEIFCIFIVQKLALMQRFSISHSNWHWFTFNELRIMWNVNIYRATVICWWTSSIKYLCSFNYSLIRTRQARFQLLTTLDTKSTQSFLSFSSLLLLPLLQQLLHFKFSQTVSCFRSPMKWAIYIMILKYITNFGYFLASITRVICKDFRCF